MVDCGECHFGGIGDRGLFSSVVPSRVLTRSRGHTCRTLRGTGSVSTHLGWLGTSLGDSRSICPVCSGALRIREELARPGSTSRTRVRNIWWPHHVPQASSNVVVAAVTLLYSGSIRPQDSGLQTRCPLLRCACLFPRTALNRLVYRPGPLVGRRKGHKKSSCASNSSVRLFVLFKLRLAGQDTLNRHVQWWRTAIAMRAAPQEAYDASSHWPEAVDPWLQSQGTPKSKQNKKELDLH